MTFPTHLPLRCVVPIRCSTSLAGHGVDFLLPICKTGGMENYKYLLLAEEEDVDDEDDEDETEEEEEEEEATA